MSSTSSSRFALRRRAPPFPVIRCPDCGRTILKLVSTTEEHDGWVFYKCAKHGFGCNFWHWEMEYIHYLVEMEYIRGDDAVEAVGWAEDRREELMLRKQEKRLAGATSAVQGQEQKMAVAVAQVVVLLKLIVALLCVLCVVLALKK